MTRPNDSNYLGFSGFHGLLLLVLASESTHSSNGSTQLHDEIVAQLKTVI